MTGAVWVNNRQKGSTVQATTRERVSYELFRVQIGLAELIRSGGALKGREALNLGYVCRNRARAEEE
jgi:hypothetical protein